MNWHKAGAMPYAKHHQVTLAKGVCLQAEVPVSSEK